MCRRLTMLLAVGLAVASLTASLARADGDPASDVLYTQWVFLPFEVKFDASMKNALLATVKAAKDRGYPIKVALIVQRSDLGAIPQLFAKPEQYARFLGLELRFLYHGRLLIVMPNGFGVSRDGKLAARERRLLQGVPLGRGDDAMVEAATRAVRTLAASAGVRLPAVQVSPSHSSTGSDRLVIAYAAVGGSLLLVVGWLVRHRRRAGRWL